MSEQMKIRLVPANCYAYKYNVSDRLEKKNKYITIKDRHIYKCHVATTKKKTMRIKGCC